MHNATDLVFAAMHGSVVGVACVCACEKVILIMVWMCGPNIRLGAISKTKKEFFLHLIGLTGKQCKLVRVYGMLSKLAS